VRKSAAAASGAEIVAPQYDKDFESASRHLTTTAGDTAIAVTVASYASRAAIGKAIEDQRELDGEQSAATEQETCRLLTGMRRDIAAFVSCADVSAGELEAGMLEGGALVEELEGAVTAVAAVVGRRGAVIEGTGRYFPLHWRCMFALRSCLLFPQLPPWRNVTPAEFAQARLQPW
jgi:hypothetical protein